LFCVAKQRNGAVTFNISAVWKPFILVGSLRLFGVCLVSSDFRQATFISSVYGKLEIDPRNKRQNKDHGVWKKTVLKIMTLGNSLLVTLKRKSPGPIEKKNHSFNQLKCDASHSLTTLPHTTFFVGFPCRLSQDFWSWSHLSQTCHSKQ
jgi:hypothetical protein